MTSLTQQKKDLRDILHRMVMERYRTQCPEDQEAIMQATLQRLTGYLTVRALRQWHHQMVASQMMQEAEERNV
jgi:hypothetical protein